MKSPIGMIPKPLRIGSRGSPLALWQAEHVAGRLRAARPDIEVRIEAIRTSAEKFPEEPPQDIGVGIFTREIDEELLQGRIDLAVHSLKDVPSEVPPGLAIAAVPERESPFDAFVGTGGDGARALWDLPPGSKVGTGSPRRKAQLLHRRPDLRIVPLRGNVETRIRKACEGGLAGTILALAGLRRLGKEALVSHTIPADWIVPAVGQGAICVMVRADRSDVLDRVRCLEHPPTRFRIAAERSFLLALRGGCQVPAGALAELEEPGGEPARLKLTGVLASPDGERCLRGEIRGPLGSAAEIGRRLAEDLLSRGGDEILKAARIAPQSPSSFES